MLQPRQNALFKQVEVVPPAPVVSFFLLFFPLVFPPKWMYLMSNSLTNIAENEPDIKLLVFGSVALDTSCDMLSTTSPQSAAGEIISNTVPSLDTTDEQPVTGTAMSEAPRIANGKTPAAPKLYTSNPATISSSLGGVGHNVALAAHLSLGGSAVKLCSAVADDAYTPFSYSPLNHSLFQLTHQ